MEHIPEHPASYPGAGWEFCARREEALPCQVGCWNVLSRIKAPTCSSMRGVPAACPDSGVGRGGETPQEMGNSWEGPGRADPAMFPLPVPFPSRKSWIKHADSSLHPSPTSQEEKFPGASTPSWRPLDQSNSLIFLVPPAPYIRLFSLGSHCVPNGNRCCRDILGIP